MAISRREFAEWGFRWPETTIVTAANGQQVTIEPFAYLKSRESWVTERGRVFLREYRLYYSDGTSLGPIDEYRVLQLIGPS